MRRAARRGLSWPALFLLTLFLPTLGGAQEAALRETVLRFQGNQTLGEARLREAAAFEIEDLEQQGRQRSDADDAAFQMELAYHQAGFPFAEVEYDHAEEGPTRQITFRVTEGPRVRVEALHIEGNQAFSDETLRSFFEPRDQSLLTGPEPWYFVAGEVDSAVASMRDFYHRSGYLEARLEPPETAFSADRTRVAVTLRIEEGPRHVIREVNYRGDTEPAAADELQQVRRQLEGQPYYPRRKVELRSAVLEAYGNRGHPDTGVSVEQSEREPGQVVLSARVDKGPRVRIAAVQVSGNTQTRASFIRNRLELAPGDLYRLDAQRRSFRQLYRSGLFSRVDLSLADTGQDGQRILQVTVEELPSQELYLEPGWGSYEYVRLRAGYREKNLLGTGRIGRVEGGISYRSEDITVGLTDPWFLNTQVTADLPIYYRRREEPSFTREEKGGSLSFSRPFFEHVVATLTYDYRITSITQVQVDAEPEGLDNDYNLASVRVQVTHDTRTDLFFPTAGQRTSLSGEVAQRALGSEVTFLRSTAGTRWFFGLGEATVLGLRYEAGLTVPTGDTVNLPLAERFFNGGENTVRSFRESQLGPEDASGDPVGGYGFNVASVELRRRLGGNWAGTLFFDYGNVSPNQSRSQRGAGPYDSKSALIDDTLADFFTDFRPGLGLGVQYLLPVGPARLDGAWNPRQRNGERRFSLHFSVGMAF